MRSRRTAGRSSTEPACPRCGYIIARSTSAACSECGLQLESTKLVQPGFPLMQRFRFSPRSPLSICLWWLFFPRQALGPHASAGARWVFATRPALLSLTAISIGVYVLLVGLLVAVLAVAGVTLSESAPLATRLLYEYVYGAVIFGFLALAVAALLEHGAEYRASRGACVGFLFGAICICWWAYLCLYVALGLSQGLVGFDTRVRPIALAAAILLACAVLARTVLGLRNIERGYALGVIIGSGLGVLILDRVVYDQVANALLNPMLDFVEGRPAFR